MYDNRSNLIIGFHGCDKKSANALLNKPDVIKISDEKYDWLGHGIYFWENNEERARQWARQRLSRKGLNENDAAVVGAVIQLGYCCDLMDSRFSGLLKIYHKLMEEAYTKAGKVMPVNKNHSADTHNDKLLRELDCAVIEYMHSWIEEKYKEEVADKGFSILKIFDSTRGVFMEGGRVYNGAEIFEKTHIQICVRNFNCIKGFFLPRKEIDFLSQFS